MIPGGDPLKRGRMFDRIISSLIFLGIICYWEYSVVFISASSFFFKFLTEIEIRDNKLEEFCQNSIGPQTSNINTDLYFFWNNHKTLQTSKASVDQWKKKKRTQQHMSFLQEILKSNVSLQISAFFRSILSLGQQEIQLMAVHKNELNMKCHTS